MTTPTSQPSQERIYRTPAGLLLRMLQIGEVVQKGDFTWLKQGSVEEEDPILAVAGVGRTVTAEMGNNYYRPIQGAAEGESLPEAPAEGSPSLPSQDFLDGFYAGAESQGWSDASGCDPNIARALDRAWKARAALSKLEDR